MTLFSDWALTEEERVLARRLAKADGGVHWDHKDFAPVRRRIREHFLSVTDETCAYCQRSLKGDFKLVIDVEHILPKGDFPTLTLVPLNLTVSCKRCNMEVKRTNWAFVKGVGLEATLGTYDVSDTYEIIHPNLDSPTDHLLLYVAQRGKRRVIFYDRVSDKGTATHTFFELRKLEVQTLDEAQGIQVGTSEIARRIDDLFLK